MEEKEIASPCVRNCCLDQQDMCVGCFRVLDEIVGWGAASKERKEQILLCCAARKRSANVGQVS